MILIVDSDRARADALRATLYRHFLLSDAVACSGVKRKLDAGGSFLLLFPRADDPKTPPQFFCTISRSYPSVPTVVIGEEPADWKSGDRADLYLQNPTPRALLQAIRRVCLSKGQPDPFDRIAGGIRDRIGYADHTIYGVPVRFTRAERMILRALILSFPAPLSLSELAARSCEPGKSRSAGAVKVLCSHVNRKAFETVHRPILSLEDGYVRIRTAKEN